MATVVIESLRGANAAISYTVPAKAGKPAVTRIYRFWLMELEQPHQLQGTTAQAKTYQHFYGKSFAPGQLAVQGRVRTQAQYNQFAQFIRDHQLLMVTQPGSSNTSKDTLSLMTLSIPAENLYYSGFITNFEGGVKRFNVAPPLDFSFEVIDDKHSTSNQIIPSSAKRVVWSGAFLNSSSFLSGPIINTVDSQQDTESFDSDTGTAHTTRAEGTTIP